MWFVPRVVFFLETRKHRTDAKYCSVWKLVKGEVFEIMESEENRSGIFRCLESVFLYKNFSLFIVRTKSHFVKAG
jgi:hypothetical protein